jgi:hypothetical protein
MAKRSPVRNFLTWVSAYVREAPVPAGGTRQELVHAQLHSKHC